MLKLVFAVLFAVIALNEANNYQYNYNQQNVRQLSSKSGGYGGYGSSSVQMPKPMITLPKVPSLPKVPTLPKVPALPRQPQYQSYQPPAQTPPPPPPTTTQPQVEYQSYEAPEPDQVPVPVPPPVERVFTPVKQPQYQSYQQPSIPSIPSIPVVPKMDKIPKQSSYSSYGSSLTSVPTAPSNPCIGRVPEEKLADPSNPSQFIVCLEEEQFTIMQCPISLVFNPNSLRCENTLRLVRACASNPCQNDGICTDLAAGQFRCDCQPNWTGDFCEKLDVCPPNACGPSGVCIPLAQGSPLPKFCLCNGGQSFGTDCNVVESNPCLTNDAELQNFPTKTNPAIFAHCEGNIPHLKFCLYPLVYSHELQRCDWTQSPGPVESSSSSGYGY